MVRRQLENLAAVDTSYLKDSLAGRVGILKAELAAEVLSCYDLNVTNQKILDQIV